MKARNWLNNNSAAVTILAVVMLILSLGYIIYTTRGPSYTPRVIDVYYYDLGSQKLFVDKSDKFPPIPAPSGDKGVRAYVFSCGDCSDEKQRYIGYLEMYTPKAKEALDNPQPIDPLAPPLEADVFDDGRLIRGADPKSKWVSAESDEGYEIIDTLQNKCGNQPPKSCRPNE